MESLLPPQKTEKNQPIGWHLLRLESEQVLRNQELPKDFAKAFKNIKNSSVIGFQKNKESLISAKQLIMPETARSSLVFINGVFDPIYSDISQLPSSVQLLNLAQLSSNTNSNNYIGSLSNPSQSNLLTNINNARFTDGALLIVSSNAKIDIPIQVLFINNQSTNQNTVFLPRLFVMLESNSSATLIESYHGFGCYNTYAVTEVVISANAKLTHERIQRESLKSLHYSNLSIKVEDSGYYSCRNISLGSYFSWYSQNIVMSKQNGNVVCDGLTMLNNHQFSSTKSHIDHAASNCISDQTNRIIADDTSLASFDGVINVHRGTIGTDAKQRCHGLLLSPKAQINAKPQLKIYTDDVRCTHEAAIGQLDPDMLFYLQSRGLSLPLATNLLTYAFTSHLLASISMPSLTNELYQIIMARTNTKPVEAL